MFYVVVSSHLISIRCITYLFMQSSEMFLNKLNYSSVWGTVDRESERLFPSYHYGGLLPSKPELSIKYNLVLKCLEIYKPKIKLLD